MKSRLKIIPFEDREGLVCVNCGETRSVKYKIHGENFCNKCALSVDDFEAPCVVIEEVDYGFKTSTD